PEPHEATAGAPTTYPPRFSQPDHRPVNDVCHKWPSDPATKTSIRPADQETAAGSEANSPGGPPRSCQPDQAPAQRLYQSRLSAPRRKRSSRPGSDVTAGAPLATPPSDCQPVKGKAPSACARDPRSGRPRRTSTSSAKSRAIRVLGIAG